MSAATSTPEAARRSPLLARLRAGTAAPHAAIEALPLPTRLLGTAPNLADYARYLHALAEVYGGHEPPLYAACAPETLARLGVRPKLPALLEDLAALKARGALPLCPSLAPGLSGLESASPSPGALTEARALGGLYVLEGATLGGRVLACHLRRQWPTVSTAPFCLLDFHSEAVGTHWRCFGEQLTEIVRARQFAEAELLAGARALFQALHEALRAADNACPCATVLG